MAFRLLLIYEGLMESQFGTRPGSWVIGAAGAKKVDISQFSPLELETGLVGLIPVLELVKTVIYSGQVKHERPTSAILCAPPGSGKTVCIEKTICNTAPFTSDFTAREASPIIRKQGTTHILLGDFLSVFGHKAGTVAHSLNVLAKLTGESIWSDPFTGQALDMPKSMGVVSAIPPRDLEDRKIAALFSAGGFASRFLLARFHYSPPTLARIHYFIQHDLYTMAKPYKFEVEIGAYEVKVPEDIAEKIDILRRVIKNDSTGMRAHHHLRTLAKAHARMNSRSEVSAEDFEFVRDATDFFCDAGKTL